MTEQTVTRPVTLKAKYQRGEDLPDYHPWPDEMVVKPMASHRNKVWYVGPHLATMVYDTDDGIVKFEDTPCDELVVVLSGRAILTSADGASDEYDAGDTFIVPKGWTGTWEMRDGYREMICFETTSAQEMSERWWPEHE